MARQPIINNESGLVVRGKLNDNFTELYGQIPSISSQLIEWTQGKDYQPLVITRDSEGLATTFTVKWSDGSDGTYVATNYNSTHEAYDGYTIIHVDSGLTVTQPAVTRDADGAVVVKPELIVA